MRQHWNPIWKYRVWEIKSTPHWQVTQKAPGMWQPSVSTYQRFIYRTWNLRCPHILCPFTDVPINHGTSYGPIATQDKVPYIQSPCIKRTHGKIKLEASWVRMTLWFLLLLTIPLVMRMSIFPSSNYFYLDHKDTLSFDADTCYVLLLTSILLSV